MQDVFMAAAGLQERAAARVTTRWRKTLTSRMKRLLMKPLPLSHMFLMVPSSSGPLQRRDDASGEVAELHNAAAWMLE